MFVFFWQKYKNIFEAWSLLLLSSGYLISFFFCCFLLGLVIVSVFDVFSFVLCTNLFLERVDLWTGWYVGQVWFVIFFRWRCGTFRSIASNGGRAGRPAFTARLGQEEGYGGSTIPYHTIYNIFFLYLPPHLTDKSDIWRKTYHSASASLFPSLGTHPTQLAEIQGQLVLFYIYNIIIDWFSL